MSVKVYATVPGAAIEVGNYGTATNDTPAIVPDEVAAELELEIKGLSAVARDESNPVEFPGWPARLGRTDIRVERDVVPARPPLRVSPASAPAPRAEPAESDRK
jgi:hypothetical protein